MGIQELKDKLPTKEQIFFGIALLAGGLVLFNAPRSVPEPSKLRSEAIAKQSGSLDADTVDSLLAQAAQARSAPDTAVAERLRARISKRFNPDWLNRRPELPGGRNVFLASTDKVFPLEPLRLELPVLPGLPGFDVALAEAPAIALQARPVLRPTRPVEISDDTDDGDEFGFEDN